MKVELKKDLLQVRYEAAKVTPADLLRAVAGEGFKAMVIAGPAPAG